MELKPVSFLVTPDAVLGYAHLTDDFNPLHLDAEFAAASPMKGPIAHGTLSLGVLWQALMQAEDASAATWELDIRFLRPVRIGDRVTAGGRPSGSGELEVWVRNDRGEVVIAGTASRR
jgi:3-hydroxybutyryl-CoA dehydratase